MSYTRFNEGRITLSKVFRILLQEDLHKVKSSLLHPRMVQGKIFEDVISKIMWLHPLSSGCYKNEHLM